MPEPRKIPPEEFVARLLRALESIALDVRKIRSAIEQTEGGPSLGELLRAMIGRG